MSTSPKETCKSVKLVFEGADLTNGLIVKIFSDKIKWLANKLEADNGKYKLINSKPMESSRQEK